MVNPSEGAAPEHTRRITAHDLATIVDIEGLSVSPDERWVAFQTRRPDPQTNSYALAWYVVPTQGGAPRRIGDGGDPMPTVKVNEWIYTHGFLNTPSPLWSPDSQWIVYRRQDGDRIQLWRSHVDGRHSEQLTHNEGDVHTGFEVGSDSRVIFAGDGRRLFFTTRLSQAQIGAALAVEGRTGFLFDDRFLPAKSSRPLAPSRNNLTTLWVHYFSSRNERRATEAEAAEYAALFADPPLPQGREHVRDLAVASAGGSRAWTEARDPELQGLFPPKTVIAQLAGAAAPAICGADVCTDQGLTVERWRNDKEVLFSRSPPGRRYEHILYAWRPGENAPPRQILRTRDVYESPSSWDCALAQDRLICFYEEMDRPRRLVAIDLDNGAIHTLYDPNPHWTRFDLGADPQIIPVRLPSGPEGFSYLVLPPDYQRGKRLPLIVNAYACDDFYDMRGAVGDEYPVFPFAAQGFAVLCHNIGSLDWGVAARDPSGGIPPQFGPDDGDAFMKRIQAGLDAAVAQLDRMGVIDPDRVAITGLSLGGQTVEYALIHMRLAAAISSGSHFMTSTPYLADPAGRQMLRAAGFSSSASARFDTRSISRNADRIRAPLLMNVSDAEFETESIVSLRAAGRAAEMFVYPGEFHIKSQPAHRLAIYLRNIDWMNFWLRGAEDSDRAKAAQYERWRALREDHCRVLAGADAPWYCRQAAGGKEVGIR